MWYATAPTTHTRPPHLCAVQRLHRAHRGVVLSKVDKADAAAGRRVGVAQDLDAHDGTKGGWGRAVKV